MKKVIYEVIFGSPQIEIIEPQLYKKLSVYLSDSSEEFFKSSGEAKEFIKDRNKKLKKWIKQQESYIEKHSGPMSKLLDDKISESTKYRLNDTEKDLKINREDEKRFKDAKVVEITIEVKKMSVSIDYKIID